MYLVNNKNILTFAIMLRKIKPNAACRVINIEHKKIML